MPRKNLRWYGVITLFVIVAISYVDRINIAVLITDRDFLAQVGLAADDRRSLVYGLILWGVVTWASPMFHSYGLLLASRVLLGASEGPLFSLASAYIKAHFRSDENGKPNAFVNMGTGLGLAVGYPLVGWLLAHFAWDTSFHAIGVMCWPSCACRRATPTACGPRRRAMRSRAWAPS